MRIQRFSDKQVLILKNLAKYKFLTYQQMIRLRIDKHVPNLSTQVSQLRDCRYPLIRKIPHQRSTPAKHYLTKKGVDLLVDLYGFELENVQFPKGILQVDTQDQKHRTSIINLHIELEMACERQQISILLCDRYFDTTGSNRINKNLKSKTAIIYEGKKTLKADLTFMLNIGEEKELYLLELENGKDSKKAVSKMINHAKAIFRGSANEKYDHPKAYRTLWVFEFESTLESVIKKMKDNPFIQNIKENILLKSLEDINEETFFESWKNISGFDRRLYYKSETY